MLHVNDRTMPEPTYMSKAQTAQYLSSLRATNHQRPSGSRPPPPSKYDRGRRVEVDATATDDLGDLRPGPLASYSMPMMPTQTLLHRQTEPNLSASSQMKKSPFAGRPVVRAPAAACETPKPAQNVRRTPSMTYVESGTRWMEKQEAKSLRQALEDMDLEEERKVHSAAQHEAAELVWKHQNPHASFKNPDSVRQNPDVGKDYRAHLRKGSYQRSISQSSASTGGQRSASEGSNSSIPTNHAVTVMPDIVPRKASPPNEVVTVPKRRSVSRKSYDGLAKAVASDIAKAHRRVSSGSKRILSGEKKAFMNPNDRIWEDPQEAAAPGSKQITEQIPELEAPRLPSYVRKNPFARARAQHDKVERSNSAPLLHTVPVLRHDRVEIQRNPPSQSRNPWYMSNEVLSNTLLDAADSEADEVSPKVTPTKNGKEIRGDDIRAATSKSRKDYSPKLPRPTMVSDKPGRPIVSFQKDWKPREIVLEEDISAKSMNAAKPALPSATPVSTFNPAPFKPPAFNPTAAFGPIASAPPRIPQICVDEVVKPLTTALDFPVVVDAPVLVLPDGLKSSSSNARSAPAIPAIPAINVAPPSSSVSSLDVDAQSSQRALPATRPIAHHAATTPAPTMKSSLHYTPSNRQSGALCVHCAMPIAGRILSAAGQRFHPGCFLCHRCHTNLECVAFYPEPDQQRDARIDRVRVRQSGSMPFIPDGYTAADMARLEAEDGVDESPRFYCHLDFHELFSPRCKSCKTPIEGEVIVACGAEWHAGHFFCAQCGDPFDSLTPFVEKEGYAWCVSCHTNRYSGKCRKCKKAVTDVVVKALGTEWHEACFVCTECNGDFTDGRYFLRGESQNPVCVKCEERRLKA